MMNYEKAEVEFRKFVKNYDSNHDKISRKTGHCLRAARLGEYIARELELDKEEVELAKIIALLHDIGRFEQAKIYDNFNDYETMDHGEYGARLLQKENFIRKFVEDDKYDKIILNAIRNHNKYKIKRQRCLSKKELLYNRIVRDADKLDNFEVALANDLKYLSIDNEKSMLAVQAISDGVFKDIMNHKTIKRHKLKNAADKWAPYIARVFGLNFEFCLNYVKEKNYINRFVDRFAFENKKVVNQMEEIRNCANNYIQEKVS